MREKAKKNSKTRRILLLVQYEIGDKTLIIGSRECEYTDMRFLFLLYTYCVEVRNRSLKFFCHYCYMRSYFSIKQY